MGSRVLTETIVIYHGDCSDGFTAAWAYRRLRPDQDAAYHPGRFGEPPPDVSGKNVYVLDFSYPRATLQEMADRAKSILVLDHHKSAEADLRGLPFCQFDMNRSGAGITWDYFADGDQPRHWLVDIVEDRDLWRYQFGDQTRMAMAYIASLPMTFETWDALAAGSLDALVQKGAAIQQYIDAYGEKACDQAVLRAIGGYTVPVINVSHLNCSDHIDRLLKRYPEHPFAASFFLRADGLWQFSLRSVGDFDVSEVARIYGGGGHRNASGFEIATLPW